ncbi:DUF4437 domain-containing protein [Marinomonas epiphytica]
MVKLPAGFNGKITTQASEFRAVVIAGQMTYQSKDQNSTKLPPGSYVESTGEFTHQLKKHWQSKHYYLYSHQQPISGRSVLAAQLFP